MTQATQTQSVVKRDDAVPVLRAPRLPYHPKLQETFGIDKAGWSTLIDVVFPNATSAESVILAISYCHARKMDPFKRPVHIVPIWSAAQNKMVDSIWPGIGELRTTAFRTGQYAGRDPANFGPDVTESVGSVQMTYPLWCQVTVYRMLGGQRVAFHGPKVYWRETYATRRRDSDDPNEMWATRPYGQIEKCAEAAALRAAFPEEVGNDYIPEEVEHPRVAATVAPEQVNGSKVLEEARRVRQAKEAATPDEKPDPEPAAKDQPQDTEPVGGKPEAGKGTDKAIWET